MATTDMNTNLAPEAPRTMKRRGLIAGAAALTAAVMVKSVADTTPVAADNATFTMPYNANIATDASLFYLYNSGKGNALFGSSDGTDGIVGSTHGKTGQAGIKGHASGTGSYGVWGQGSLNDGGGTGVYGTSTTSTGVRGYSAQGVGVFGVSGGGGQPFGVVGTVNAAPGFALYGVANVSGTVGFAAGAGVAGAIAGQFSGPVNIFNNGAAVPGNLYIQGNYTASGTKSAAVPHPDGSHRLLYCMESPEAWFEDFGSGTITGGKAEVKLDPDFAAIVDTNTLHVFPVSHDETHHLAVKATNAGGFSIAADVSGSAAARGMKANDISGTFSYRVVAKRKDVAAPRLAKFALPQEVKAPAPVIPPKA